MIHLTTSQTYVSIIYIIAFALILALLVHAPDPNSAKNSKHYWIYFAGVLILAIIFLGLGNAVLNMAAHFHAAAIVLVTLRFDEQHHKYKNFNSKKLTEDEAVMLSEYMSNNVSVDGYYEYNLIDDQNNMQRFHSTKPDLLEFVKGLDEQGLLSSQVRNKAIKDIKKDASSAEVPEA